MRPVLVLLHRYVGLATALFLFLAGLTGSLLAFHHESSARWCRGWSLPSPSAGS
ncbi:PepSY domain-containing protein, partial [Pseudomonas aeruginosa]